MEMEMLDHDSTSEASTPLICPPTVDHRYSCTRAAHVPTNLCLPWPRPRQLA